MKIEDARFLLSAPAKKYWPEPRLPEVAFAGRSNVGKSSLVNALVGRRALARVSSTPGRTRTLNFVDVTLAGTGPLKRMRMVDLPGYGYAKVSKVEKRRWGPMVESYVMGRDGLALVVLVTDARRPPTDLDVAMAGWLTETGRPWVGVATKLDKFAKTRRGAAIREAEKALSLPAGSVVGFSAEEGIGRDALWRRIGEACSGV